MSFLEAGSVIAGDADAVINQVAQLSSALPGAVCPVLPGFFVYH
jgi:hypothetical protein